MPRHHNAVLTERCSVLVLVRTGPAAASRDSAPAPERRCASPDVIANAEDNRTNSRTSPRSPAMVGPRPESLLTGGE